MEVPMDADWSDIEALHSMIASIRDDLLEVERRIAFVEAQIEMSETAVETKKPPTDDRAATPSPKRTPQDTSRALMDGLGRIPRGWNSCRDTPGDVLGVAVTAHRNPGSN
jgi:hypothetical protein